MNLLEQLLKGGADAVSGNAAGSPAGSLLNVVLGTIGLSRPSQQSPVPVGGDNRAQTQASLQPIAGSNAAATPGPTYYADLERRYNLPSGYLSRTAQIESGGNPNAVSPTGATGVFQFTQGTANDYGLTNRRDPVASAEAAARLASDNAAILRRRLGREPTGAELYLAHQQGAGGASAMLTGQGGVDPNNMAANGGSPGMGQEDFANMWLARFDKGVSQPQITATGSGSVATGAGASAEATVDASNFGKQRPVAMTSKDAPTLTAILDGTLGAGASANASANVDLGPKMTISGQGSVGVGSGANSAPTGAGTAPSAVPTGGDTTGAGSAPPEFADPLERTAAQKSRDWWSRLGVGLGQISHGDTVDLTGVIQLQQERQQIAQQRVDAIVQERKRVYERAQDRGWSVSDQAAATDRAVALQQAQLEADAAEQAAKQAFDMQQQADKLTADANLTREELAAAKARGDAESANRLAVEAAKAENERRQAVANAELEAKAAQDRIKAESAARVSEDKVKIINDIEANKQKAAAANVEATKMLSTNPDDPQLQTAVKATEIAAASGQDLNDVTALVKPPAAAASVTFMDNAGYSAAVKDAYATKDAASAAADAAASGLPYYNTVRNSIRAGKLTTGLVEGSPIYGAVLKVGDALGVLGPDGKAQLDNAPVMAAAANMAALAFKAAGSQSNTEFIAYLSGSPAMDKPELVNDLLLTAKINEATVLKQKAIAAANYAARLSGTDNTGRPAKSFEAEWYDAQQAGAAPQVMYGTALEPQSIVQITNAYKNGFIQDGDLITVRDTGETLLVPMSRDVLTRLQQTSAEIHK